MSTSMPNNTLLGIMFKRLRKEEGLDNSKLMSTLEPEMIYSILLNARCKQEKDTALTALEESVKNEAGNYIRIYVAEKWEKLKQEQGSALPYPELATKTISDVLSDNRMNA